MIYQSEIVIENHHLIGKPSISMDHLYHGYVSHNQRVTDVYTHFLAISQVCHGHPWSIVRQIHGRDGHSHSGTHDSHGHWITMMSNTKKTRYCDVTGIMVRKC